MVAALSQFFGVLDKAGFDRKQYQIDGVRWILKNETTNLPGRAKGGLIADEMGLGKTIQIIGGIVCNFKMHTLIVLPLSLLDQWKNIIINVLGHHPLVYHGAGRKSITMENISASPIVLTTYGMASSTKDDKPNNIIHHMEWDRVIFDEAHHLRNKKTKAHIGAKMIKAPLRWLITGTPIQNTKQDFYSLCEIMGLSSSYYSVDDNIRPIAKNYMLKRTKAEVGINLPKLTHHHELIPWKNDGEKDLAQDIHALLNFSRVSAPQRFSGIQDISLDGCPLPILMRARQMCVYPKLVEKHLLFLMEKGFILEDDMEDICEAVKYSSKIDAVASAVIHRLHNGRGKLVFCHYRGEIDILAEHFTEAGMNVITFDGRTKTEDRNYILTQHADVLILQIQTGCEGLNLQQYSEIYFASPHWNPAVEDQAVARCHRIGQTEPVDVYRFEMEAFDEDEETRTLDAYCTDVQDAKRKIMTILDE